MGIFKDFAASGYGDFTVGALQGLAEAGQRDAERNSVFAQDSLNKENVAFAETELAFKNKKEITNIIANNPLAFGITATADLNANQIADRLTNRIFNEQRSIFENKDFNKVKMGVAQYLTRPDNIGTGIELTSPYVPSEDLFQAEKDKHSAKLSEISKMPKVDKLLMNIQEAEESIATPEAITDSLTKVASITAKGYGILNTFPGTPEGDTNLKFMQTNIIVANAKAQFPNNATERANFIDKKLYDNNIDPMAAVSFQNPVTFKAMSKVLEVQGNRLASSIAENTNKMAQAKTDEERALIQNQTNQLIMQQYALINTYSQSVPMAIAGRDRDDVEMSTDISTQESTIGATDYVPSIDGKGDLVIKGADGIISTVPFEEFLNNSTSFQLLPKVAQNYVSNIESKLFKDGIMIKPTREMFNAGPLGDKAFKDFLNLYNRIEIRREGSIEELGGMGFIESPPKRVPRKDADIGQFKDTTETTNSSQKKKL